MSPRLFSSAARPRASPDRLRMAPARAYRDSARRRSPRSFRTLARLPTALPAVRTSPMRSARSSERDQYASALSVEPAADVAKPRRHPRRVTDAGGAPHALPPQAHGGSDAALAERPVAGQAQAIRRRFRAPAVGRPASESGDLPEEKGVAPGDGVGGGEPIGSTVDVGAPQEAAQSVPHIVGVPPDLPNQGGLRAVAREHAQPLAGVWATAARNDSTGSTPFISDGACD